MVLVDTLTQAHIAVGQFLVPVPAVILNTEPSFDTLHNQQRASLPFWSVCWILMAYPSFPYRVARHFPQKGLDSEGRISACPSSSAPPITQQPVLKAYFLEWSWKPPGADPHNPGNKLVFVAEVARAAGVLRHLNL